MMLKELKENYETILPRPQEVLDVFSFFDTWQDRYEYLLDLADKLPVLDISYKNDTFKVSGCVSKVWLIWCCEERTAKIFFTGDSDSRLVRGLLTIIVIFFSNKTAQEILKSDIDTFLKKLHIEQGITPQRTNGLHYMVKKIQSIAKSFICEN